MFPRAMITIRAIMSNFLDLNKDECDQVKPNVTRGGQFDQISLNKMLLLCLDLSLKKCAK